MISVAKLKELIYKETGYKIQVQDNDPILSAFYVNLATLGEALKHAERIQKTTLEVIDSLPGAADLEMQRASEKALYKIAEDVVSIAQSFAEDASAVEKAKAISKSTRLAAIGVATCALVFGAVGYVLSMSIDRLEIYGAREQVKAAKEMADNAINEAAKNRIWVETDSGKAAYHFYKTDWPILVNCNAPFLEKVGSDGCRMKQDYGWLGANNSPVWTIVFKQ